MENGLPGANIGAYQAGSGQMVVGTAVGQQNNYSRPDPGRSSQHDSPKPRADVGVITVLPQEIRAVVRVFRRTRRYRAVQLYGGAQIHEAEFPVSGGALRAVASQALDRGPRSAVVAYQRLRKHYAPPIVLLVGIAGAIRPGVAVGDVVISDQVVYYDARRETDEGARRRGQSYPIASALGHRLNDFFQTCGNAWQHGSGPWFQVYQGPIGSGDAVVTDRGSDIRRWLSDFHEKVLAVETEAAGIAQAFYEEVRQDDALGGWLTIRGISDHADAAKGHSDHDLAADHAAVVLEKLLPFLLLTGGGDT